MLCARKSSSRLDLAASLLGNVDESIREDCINLYIMFTPLALVLKIERPVYGGVSRVMGV